MKKIFLKLKNDNKGMGVVEMVLIIFVLVGLVVIFKTQASTIITNIFNSITTKVKTL